MDKMQRLKEILGINEQAEKQARLEHRISDPKSRAQDVAEVLPGALRQSQKENFHELVYALRKPTFKAWQQSAIEHPKEFTQTLIPVIGPAISGAVAHNLKILIQKINQAMEHTLSPKGIRWRLEAWRSGLTYGEVVLRNTLIFRVEQVFLIDQASGLLLAEDGNADLPMDEDAMSAMLTAVQDFIRDSVGNEHSSGLRAAEIDDRTIWVVPGTLAQLALVISGQPRHDLRGLFAKQLRHIHLSASDWISQGDPEIPPPLSVIDALKACLLLEEKSQDTSEKKSLKWLLWSCIFAALFVWSAWVWFENWQQSKRFKAFSELVANEPGVVLYELDRSKKPVSIGVLNDPLAVEVQTLIEQAKLDSSQLIIRNTPFQSLENEMVAQRIKRRLLPPDSVQIQADPTQLKITGYADDAWLQKLDQLELALAENQIDRSELRNIKQEMFEWLQAPQSINVILIDDRLLLQGSAPLSWIQQAQQDWNQQWPMFKLDLSQIQSTERLTLESEVHKLAQFNINFIGGTEPDTDDLAGALNKIIQQRQRIQQLAESLNLEIVFFSVGYSDFSGSVITNRNTQKRRAEWIQNELQKLGIETEARIRMDLDDPLLPSNTKQAGLSAIIQS